MIKPQNKKDTAVAVSDIEQQVREGKGFYSVCRENRKQSKRTPARQSVYDLECALKLIGKKPEEQKKNKDEKNFYWKKLIRLFEPTNRFFNKKDNLYQESKELQRKFRDLVDNISNQKPKGNIPIPNDNSGSFQEEEITDAQIDSEENKRKFLIYNYLTAQGIPPQEAKQQVESIVLAANNQ